MNKHKASTNSAGKLSIMERKQVSINSGIYQKMKEVAKKHGRKIPDQTERALDTYLVGECSNLEIDYAPCFEQPYLEKVKQIRISAENHAFLKGLAQEQSRSVSGQLGWILQNIRAEKNKADG